MWIPNKKSLIFSIGVFIISLVIYLGVYYLANSKISHITEVYAGTEDSSFKKEQSLLVKSVKDQNENYITKLQNFFIGKGNEVSFIEQVEQSAKDSNISFVISSISSTKNPANVDTKGDIFVRVEIEGSWTSIMKFVSSLERMSFGVNIKSVNLDTRGEGIWTGATEFIVFKEK